MNFRFTISFIFLVLTINHVIAQRGKQGNLSLSPSSPGPNYIVNEYTSLIADAQAGQTFIEVSNAGLNPNNRFSGTLEAGDLLFIIQIQGASITTPDDSTYGDIVNYNGAGNYEWMEVSSVDLATNTIGFSCGLEHNYSTSGKTQIVRVPRYLNLSIQSNARITSPQWNGITGGIVVIETNGNLSIQSNANIDVSGMGFRGGSTGTSASVFGGLKYRTTIESEGAEKGESIAGSQADYDLINGRFCRGAAANGGGGGNAHNSGGGGGANAGNPSLWTGKGNPSLTTANWSQAWNKEYAGFANSTSTGGGRGGYCFSGNNLNALNIGPGLGSWGGDYRNNHGGLGGHPLDYSIDVIFMGGGGGGGEQNNIYGGNGGNGGGIIAIRAFGTVSGDGKIQANGANGEDAEGNNILVSGTDGAGGAGAGGTIIIDASGTISNMNIEAKGGNGGNQNVLPLINEAEGPGGGGGGGFIGITNPVALANVSGGNNGTTDSNALTEFIPNGATKGGNGEIFFRYPLANMIASSDTICSSGLATLNAYDFINFPIYWSETPCGFPLETSDTFSVNVDSTRNFYLSSCLLRQTIETQVSIQSSPTVDAGNDLYICQGQSATLNANGNGTFLWNENPSLSNVNIPNPTANPSDTTLYFVTLTDVNGCSGSDSVLVIVGDFLQIELSNDTSICQGSSIQLSIAGATSYTWTPSSSINTLNPEAPIVNPTQSETYYVNALASGGCSAMDSVRVTVFPTSNFQVSGGGLWCNTPVEIQALNISNVTWQPANGLSNPNATQTLASPSDSTWYHASGLDLNGCAVSADDSVLVIPGNAPAASFTYQQLNNYEVAFTNTSTNAEQSTWIVYGSTFTTADCLFNFPFDNTYTVELIVQNACGSDTIQTVINVIKMVGIEDVETNLLNIYPNPANDLVSVFNPFQSKSALIQVFDVKGACVLQRNMMDSSINIDLSQLQAGLYELLVSDGSKRFTARLLHQ
jgi:hypothetical protein